MKFLKKLLALFIFLAMAFEVLLRLSTYLPQNSFYYTFDKKNGLRLKQGFNQKYYEEKKNNHKRIAIIGDSFVHGVVAENRHFTHIIQEKAAYKEPQIEILKLGIPGSGPNDYHKILQKDILEMNSDIVGVMLFVGNDISESHPDFITQIWLGAPNQILKKPYLIAPSKEYLYSYRALRTIKRFALEKTKKNEDGTFSLENYLAIEYQRSHIMKKNYSNYTNESYKGTFKMIQDMAQFAQTKNIKLFVILAPDEIQVNKELQTIMINKYNLKENDYDFELPQKILNKYLKENNITFIDLLPSFKKANAKNVLYKKQDSHWNEHGNLIAAEAIYTFLEQHFL